jgi:hypothetical protein
MTAIATRDGDFNHAIHGSALAVWAESARQATLVASQLAGTPFVPVSLRGVRSSRDQTDADLDRITVGNIIATILTGQELGLQPMAALRSMDVINGTPALRAITLRALVQAHGHEVWLEESNATRAIVCGRRAGSEKVQTSVWTMDRARGLGIAGKDNWHKQPGAMLVARATAECCRLVAADVIMAMPYAAEELYDGDEWVAATEEAAVKPQSRRTAQRKTATQPPVAAQPEETSSPEPEPEFGDPVAPAPAATETVESSPMVTETETPDADAETPELEPDPPERITRDQSAKLHATFNAYGVKSRSERLRVSAAIISRDIATSSDLTKQEASSLIDTLDSVFAAAETEGGDPRERLLLICDVPLDPS